MNFSKIEKTSNPVNFQTYKQCTFELIKVCMRPIIEKANDAINY